MTDLCLTYPADFRKLIPEEKSRVISALRQADPTDLVRIGCQRFDDGLFLAHITAVRAGLKGDAWVEYTPAAELMDRFGITPDCDTCHGLGIVKLWSNGSQTIIPCPECSGEGTKEG